MALPRFDKLEPERRDALLQSALEEFVERGYEQASMNQIIARAGVSKGAMYYYFEGKEDLFATLIERQVLEHWQAIGPLPVEQLTAHTFWDELRQFMLRFMEFFFSDNLHLRLWRVCQQACQDPHLARVMHKRMGQKQDFLRGLVTRGQEVGAVRRDMEVELLVQLCDAVAITHEAWIASQDHAPPTQEQLIWRVQLRHDLIQRLLTPAEPLSDVRLTQAPLKE